MPLGVIQTRDREAPGTVVLIDNENHSAAFNFKHAKGKVQHDHEILSIPH